MFQGCLSELFKERRFYRASRGARSGVKKLRPIFGSPVRGVTALHVVAAVPKLVVRDSDTVREGQSIAFMGFPIGGALGFSPVTHRGMVSSITAIALPTANSQQLNARTIASLRSGSFDIFQLDATAYPGNSGGPMFDTDSGEVLGVINMVFVKGTKESALTNPSGISYAIPSKFILQLLQKRKGN